MHARTVSAYRLHRGLWAALVPSLADDKELARRAQCRGDSRHLSQRVRDCWLISCARCSGGALEDGPRRLALGTCEAYRPTKRDQSQSLKH